MMRTTTMRLFALAAMLCLYATQMLAIDDKDYKAYAAEVRKNVWAQTGLPEFDKRTYPEKYKNESGVILAAYDEISLDQKSKVRMSGLSLIPLKQLNYTRLYRMRIAINDDAALKKNSEFDYTAYNKVHNRYYGNDIVRNVLGVRIIKPDGSMREVNTDDYVTANEGKNGKKKGEKLAVPGLQVGDILDVFAYTEKQIREENIDPIILSYAGDYPILSYRIRCTVDPKLTTQYRLLNGAPEFKHSTDADENIVLDAMATNIDKTEPDLWYNVAKQTPLAMIYIQARYITSTYTPTSVYKKGLQANPSAETIQQDDWGYWSFSQAGLMLPEEKRTIKEAQQKFKTDEEKADYLYNYINAVDMRSYKRDLSPSDFISVFCKLLAKTKIPFQRIITTTDNREPLDKLISYRNTTWLVRLKNGKLYAPPTGPIAPGYIPSGLQGRMASVNTSEKRLFDKGTYETITLPMSKPEDNVSQYDIRAKIDGTLLHIDRTTKLTGRAKEDLAAFMPTCKQLVEAYAADYGEIKSYEEAFDKKYRKAALERAAREDEEQPEKFKEEVEAYQGNAAKSVESYKIVAIGNKKTTDAFVYNADYTMDGMVKKAGPNLILSIGKVMGKELQIEGKERKRTADINRPAPSQTIWNISMELPQGYQVSPESLSKLNTQIDNDCAQFRTTASVSGNVLTLTVKKVFKHKDEPAANWQKLLSVCDASANFTSMQVVLRKK